MARTQPEQPLVPSVLDRLLDDEPDVRRDPVLSRNQVMRELKQAVSRDLENLLNTRQRCVPWPADLAELEKSLVNYGMPDVSGNNMGLADGREQLRRLLETVIQRWEPRFKTVHVHLLDNAETLDRTLRFRIDALMYATPAPEQVVFDSALEPATGTILIRGAST